MTRKEEAKIQALENADQVGSEKNGGNHEVKEDEEDSGSEPAVE